MAVLLAYLPTPEAQFKYIEDRVFHHTAHIAIRDAGGRGDSIPSIFAFFLFRTLDPAHRLWLRHVLAALYRCVLCFFNIQIFAVSEECKKILLKVIAKQTMVAPQPTDDTKVRRVLLPCALCLIACTVVEMDE